MRVRVCQKARPWSDAQGTWFYGRQGEEFEVISVHDTIGRLYEVDVSHLIERGEIDVRQAFIPSQFAEELSY